MPIGVKSVIVPEGQQIPRYDAQELADRLDLELRRIDIPRDVPAGEGWLIGVAFVRTRPERPSG